LCGVRTPNTYASLKRIETQIYLFSFLARKTPNTYASLKRIETNNMPNPGLFVIFPQYLRLVEEDWMLALSV
jgi:hypothetical protein